MKHSFPEIVEDVPAREWRLSEVGRAYAERLAHQLIRFKPDVIVSSDEPKARETGEIIARVHQAKLSVQEDLHEHERDNVPYLSQDAFEASVCDFFQKPAQIVFGNESADQAYIRFARAVDSVIKWHPGKRVCIVAHGTVISLFVSRLTGISDFELWKELGLPSFLVLDLDTKRIIARENKI